MSMFLHQLASSPCAPHLPLPSVKAFFWVRISSHIGFHLPRREGRQEHETPRSDHNVQSLTSSWYKLLEESELAPWPAAVSLLALGHTVTSWLAYRLAALRPHGHLWSNQQSCHTKAIMRPWAQHWTQEQIWVQQSQGWRVHQALTVS